MVMNLKAERLARKLKFELGPIILSYLSNPDVTEVMLNPDGKLWIDHKREGLTNTNEVLTSVNAWQLLGTIAAYAGLVINADDPTLETELPLYGFRFSGMIPPIVKAPSFAIRKGTTHRLTLADYIASGRLTEYQATILRAAITNRQSLLIVGGPGTGKTTFANALLREMVTLGHPCQRFVIIEDTPELSCEALNTLPMQTSAQADHDHLLRTALWQRPDKICVGESRGKEMLTLLNAWNTGTCGGLATLHANSAQSALLRVKELAEQSGKTVSPSLIVESIHFIIALGFGETKGRVIKEIIEVVDYKEGNYVLKTY